MGEAVNQILCVCASPVLNDISISLLIISKDMMHEY